MAADRWPQGSFQGEFQWKAEVAVEAVEAREEVEDEDVAQPVDKQVVMKAVENRLVQGDLEEVNPRMTILKPGQGKGEEVQVQVEDSLAG